LSNNNQEEFVLRKIFKDFDTNGSGAITIDELLGMLAKLGISVERKYANGILKVLDQNKSGQLEFEEFTTFLLYSPYK
jgi:Ca2+-binding EF-hand superfamily protein